MANVLIARGGEPDFKGFMCDGQWAQYGPSYNTPQIEYTPPFNSHADAVYGQGYLNLHFPLVPNLNGTLGHQWMQDALKGLNKKGDVLFTNWVPTRAYLDSIYVEVSRMDKILDGVYVLPVAYRVTWDFDKEDWKYAEIAEYAKQLEAGGFPKKGLPLGTWKDEDLLYGVARLVAGSEAEAEAVDPKKLIPCTFGHNILKPGKNGKPAEKAEGLDDYFGAVLLGMKFTDGENSEPDDDADGVADKKVAKIWQSDIAVHFSAKLLAFEGSTQVG